ncbi:conserved hypothetical protein [Vibrio chagasii]|nr:conserved hypothetical protein [Vibrio chagasii]
MKYLASVYSYGAKTDSDVDTLTRDERASYVMSRLKDMIVSGGTVYSPIAHWHQMSKEHGLPNEYAFFQRVDRAFIDKSDGVVVLKMPHWEKSEGITDEINYAESLGLPVEYLDCPDYIDRFIED